MGAKGCVIVWALSLILSATPRATAQTGPTVDADDVRAPQAKRVLILQQSGAGKPIHGRFEAAFVEALRTAEGPVDLFEETIDGSRSSAPEPPALVAEYMRSKYAGRPIDVIVAKGFGPLAFARENRELFGSPPIVAVALAPGQIIGARDDVTGLQSGFFIAGTINLALTLLPDTERVVVIDGARSNSGRTEAEVERQWSERRPSASLVYLRDLPLSALVSRVAALPARSIVFFIRQRMRTPTQDVDELQALSEVVAASRAPVFSEIQEAVGRGAVGGYVWRLEDDARRMAQMVAQIASGARARDLPAAVATYTPLVDWRQLQHWRIPESRLPVGTVVLFRSPSFLEINRKYVLGGVVVFAAQLGLIIGLVAQRVHRRRAERQSRQDEERYRSVVDTQSELICRFLPDTTLTFVNDAYCRFWNKSQKELLGTKFIELIPPTARDTVLARIAALTSGVDSLEHAVTMADGTTGWQHWINHAIVDDRGQLIELQGVGRDITDRRRAEEAIYHLEARNSAILRAIPDLMFVLTRDGTYVDCHARDPKLLFVPPSEFLGRNIRDVMPAALAGLFIDALARTRAGGEPVVLEYEMQLDQQRHFEARLVDTENGRVLTMVRDVTEAKRAAEINRDLAGRLIASQEDERQRIARELHDDLSQKIALLNIEIDQLARRVGGEPQASLRKLALDAAAIATDVHNLSHELHPSKLQTLGLVTAIQSLCRDMSRQLNVDVEFSSSGLPPSVDPNVSLCLYRITQEALHNVSRHSRARHAWVTLKCDEQDIHLQIADSGDGFDTTAAHAGLGLVSMRERVSFLRGTLVVHSAPGHGTRIGVRIALNPSTSATGAQFGRQESASATQGARTAGSA